jgi:carbonic anhydrase
VPGGALRDYAGRGPAEPASGPMPPHWSSGKVDRVRTGGGGRQVSTPDVIAELLAGNRRFVQGEPRSDRPRPRPRFAPPIAAVVACMDGRVPVEAAFDQEINALVSIRSGGHVVDEVLLGSVVFAVSQLGVRAVLVLGHTACAAVEATIESVRTGDRPAGPVGRLVQEIAPAVPEAGEDPSVLDVVRAHVRRTVARLCAEAPLPQGDPASVVGAVYDIHTGRVMVVD